MFLIYAPNDSNVYDAKGVGSLRG